MWVGPSSPGNQRRESNLVSVHGDQVVPRYFDTVYIMFQKSAFLYLSDMQLVFQQRHSFITQPGTTNGTNGVKTRTFPILCILDTGYNLCEHKI